MMVRNCSSFSLRGISESEEVLPEFPLLIVLILLVVATGTGLEGSFSP